MAKLIPTANRFQEASIPTPVIPKAPDFSKVTNAFLKQAEEMVIEEATNAGLSDQIANPDALQEKDGFLGFQTTASKAYNKAAELAFKSQKVTELETNLYEIEQQYAYNRPVLEEKLNEFRSKFVGSLPVQMRPRLGLAVDQVTCSPDCYQSEVEPGSFMVVG